MRALITIVLLVILFLVWRWQTATITHTVSHVPYTPFSEVNVPNGFFAVVFADGTLQIAPPPCETVTMKSVTYPSKIVKVITKGCHIDVKLPNETLTNESRQVQTILANDIVSVIIHPKVVSCQSTYTPFSVANVPRGFYAMKMKDSAIAMFSANSDPILIDDVNRPVEIMSRHVNLKLMSDDKVEISESGATVVRIPSAVKLTTIMAKPYL